MAVRKPNPRMRPVHKCSVSCEVARMRTRLAVASDRLSCNQEEYTQMQNELKAVLSKYMNLESESFEIQIEIVYGTKRGVQNVKTIQIE